MPWHLTILVVLTLILAPLGARAADLVVWWDKAVSPKEEAALHDSQAVHRVVADGISPEQAVDEAVARIKQILSE